jgi:hypothetical protein
MRLHPETSPPVTAIQNSNLLEILNRRGFIGPLGVSNDVTLGMQWSHGCEGAAHCEAGKI